MSQKFEIGENTHHEIHLEKDKVPVLLNHYFWKNIEIDSSVRKAFILLFSNYLVRLIHLFERLLLFYFPIIWSNRGIQTKQFSINRWVCHSFDFSLQETDFSASKRTWSHNWARDMKWLWKKAQRKFYFFSVFVAVVFVSRKQNQVNFIFSVRLKNCAVKSFLGWTFFPFVRINGVLFYLQRWQVWLLPICRRNISAAIKRQSSALSDF